VNDVVIVSSWIRGTPTKQLKEKTANFFFLKKEKKMLTMEKMLTISIQNFQNRK
jgi:hypothetical protein